MLQQLAHRGCTVVTVLHQPNSDVVKCFDDFLLMAAGQTIYHGA